MVFLSQNQSNFMVYDNPASLLVSDPLAELARPFGRIGSRLLSVLSTQVQNPVGLLVPGVTLGTHPQAWVNQTLTTIKNLQNCLITVAKCDTWIHRVTQGTTMDGPFGRGVTLRVGHDTIIIAIRWSWYNTYHDTLRYANKAVPIRM